MTYHLSTPETGHKPIREAPSLEDRLRALERAAQALVDACYEDMPSRSPNWDASGKEILWGSVSYTRRCRLCRTTHHFTECPVSDLERLLRGTP